MKKRITECPNCHKHTIQVESQVPRWKSGKSVSILIGKVWVCQNCYSFIITKSETIAYPNSQDYDLES